MWRSNRLIIDHFVYWEGKNRMLIGKEMIDHLMVLGPYFKEIYGRDLVVWISDQLMVLSKEI